MKLDDVRIVAEPLVQVTPADIDGLESRLWITFPDGYREYMTRLGEGVLGGSLIRIFPPWRIEAELPVWRRRINKYWFWDEGRNLLPKERALECVIIGDTVNGDELAFHPARSSHLFVLPRESEQVFDLDGNLLMAIDWMCRSGQLVEPFPERDFEPFDSRKLTAASAAAAGTVADPEGESLEDLIALGKRWAQRHSFRNMAKKAVAEQAGTDRISKLQSESIVLEESYSQTGYRAVFQIKDKASGWEVATFTWTWDADPLASALAEFKPNQATLAKLEKLK